MVNCKKNVASESTFVSVHVFNDTTGNLCQCEFVLSSYRFLLSVRVAGAGMLGSQRCLMEKMFVQQLAMKTEKLIHPYVADNSTLKARSNLTNKPLKRQSGAEIYIINA